MKFALARFRLIHGGWASIAAVDLIFAIFGLTFCKRGVKGDFRFWGRRCKCPMKELVKKAISYDVVNNLKHGGPNYYPKKMGGIQSAFNYGYPKQMITPEFDPVYDDLKLNDRYCS